ncbi:MAG TPA: MerR family transcriptional regulator [Ignavibacteria bacterium]|nr:MerR family transcriptional regulator [Ignavibacteria bacterium]
MKKNFAMKKLYYSISEVSKITDLEQYVLRYWETEFDHLKPAKNLAGNRIYTNKDIKLILYIKKLLRDEKYTIEGAKKLLKNYNSKEEEITNTYRDDSKHREQPQPQLKIVKYSDNELSLFGGQYENKDLKNIIEENQKLKKDLYELKSLLGDLLKNI